MKLLILAAIVYIAIFFIRTLYDWMKALQNTLRVLDDWLQGSTKVASDEGRGMEQAEQIQRQKGFRWEATALKQFKPFALGILFFFFALSIFGFENPSPEIRAIAIGMFALSVLFLASVLIRSFVPRFLLRIIASFGHVVPQAVLESYAFIVWFLAFVAYLLGHILTMAEGLEKIERDALGISLEVVGIIWFFVIFMVLIAPSMRQGALKPYPFRLLFVALVTATSLGVIILGAIWASQAIDFGERLVGFFHIAAGIALALAFLKRERLSAEM